MYINNKSAAEYAARVNERIFSNGSKKETAFENTGRRYCTHIGNKTWPEVIRLYKEYKSEKALLS